MASLLRSTWRLWKRLNESMQMQSGVWGVCSVWLFLMKLVAMTRAATKAACAPPPLCEFNAITDNGHPSMEARTNGPAKMEKSPLRMKKAGLSMQGGDTRNCF
jgi:hypothetical protein